MWDNGTAANASQIDGLLATTNGAATVATQLARLDAAVSSAGSTALVTTTIATLASQTSFTLTAGSTDDDAYNNCVAIVTDASTSTQKAFGTIGDYTGSTKTVALKFDPDVFTMAAGDTISIVTPVAEASGPIEHISVPSSRILVVSSRGDGTFGVNGRIRMRAGETLWWAVELKGTQLSAGDLVDAMSPPTLSGAQAANMTVPSFGVFGTAAKVKCVLSGSATTTDTINVVLSITPDSGETILIVVPVTVGS
ncbi:MAG: hypothetical protein IT540_20705 [Hyphomicrobium sp.]|nr:hypothetical protein [Hyphomicrobium sp.]